MFVKNCMKIYSVGENVTINEQLIPFRRNCSFRRYTPKKPDKYGLKLFLLCDVVTAYAFNVVPYVAQGKGRRWGIRPAHNTAKMLVETLHNSGINVMADFRSTSCQLAADLLRNKITLLGTMHKTAQMCSQNSENTRGERHDPVCLGFTKNKCWCLMSRRRERW